MTDQPVGATPAMPASTPPSPASPSSTPASTERLITHSSRAEPVPLGTAVLAGPLELRVRDVLVGSDAVTAIVAGASTNAQPRDGTTYVAVKLAARNTGDKSIWLDNDDFALTGDSGLIHRFLGVKPPDPALALELAPGASAEGWLAFAAAVDEGSLLLLFDSVERDGLWADSVLALQDGAHIPDRGQPVAAPNTAGADIGAALGVGEAAITGEWSVELRDVVSAAAAFDLVDYRAGALGSGDATGADGSVWVALHFHIQNVGAGGEAAYFPANAFTLVDEGGDPLPDVLALTPPWPDAAGGYYPGAAREGWVMFDVPVDYTAGVVRFQPFAHTAPALDPRYFRFA